MGRSDRQTSSPWAVPAMATSGAAARPVSATSVDASTARPGAKRPRGPLTRRATAAPSAGGTFVWLGAHGGSGAASLAAATGRGLTLSRAWPDPSLGWPTGVAIVCRSHIAGLDAADRLLAETFSGAVSDVDVLALVVVADAPVRPTRLMRDRLHELDVVVPKILHLPWIPAWRETPGSPDRTARSVAATVAALANTKETP